MKLLINVLTLFLAGCSPTMMPKETKAFFTEHDIPEAYDEIKEQYEKYCIVALPEKSHDFGFRTVTYGGIGSSFEVFEILGLSDGSGLVVQKRGYSNTTIERTDKISADRLRTLKNKELKLDDFWKWPLPDKNPEAPDLYDVKTIIMEIFENGERHMIFRSSVSQDKAFWTLIKAIEEIEKRSEPGSAYNSGQSLRD